MRRDTARVLTTHTGSLPRPAGSIPALYKQAARETLGDPAFGASVRVAVADVVGRQLAAGIDIINDGEQNKVGYSTYVTSRLMGFGGEHVELAGAASEFRDFPAWD